MKFLIFVLTFFLTVACVKKIEKPAEAPPETSEPAVVEGPNELDIKLPALAWKNAEWDAILYDEISRYGLDDPKDADVDVVRDADEYCPKFKKLSQLQRKHFWGTLLVAMAKRESSWNPSTEYKESFNDARGKAVISRGLFQMSIESSNGYGCGFKEAAEIHDPKKAIPCAVKVVNNWVQKDGYIGKTVGGKNLGCARYWSVCRDKSSSREYIIERTRALSFCG